MRLLLAFAFALLVSLAMARLPPLSDETYYWTWSKAPALAYLDHPPGIAWALWASTALLGDGLLGLRWLSFACMAGTAALVAATAVRRGGSGWLAAATLAGAPMFALGYLAATPDPLQGATIALASYSATRAVEGDRRFAFLFTFTLASGILIKHTTVLILIGSVAAGLLDPLVRRVLLSRAALLGAIAGGVLSIPWLMADASTGFQATRVFGGPARGPVAIPIVVGSMAGTLGPQSALLLLALPLLRPRGAALLEAGGSTFLLFGCFSAVWLGTGEANWPMPALVFALPGMIALIARHETFLSRAFARASYAMAALMVIGLLHIVLPFLPIPAEKDRTLRDAGYADVAAAAEASATAHGARALIARRYQVASELRYHLQDRLTVVETGTSRKSQYDLWPRPPLCMGDAAVVVLPRPGVPREIDAVPLAATATVVRGRAGRTLEPYFVTPVRITSDRGCR
jgi:dolichol-phosphate mannosyltransferase